MKVVISERDVLTPYAEFEKSHHIEDARNDIPKFYLGISPSKYYRTIDMNIAKLRQKVDSMFKKFTINNPC